MSDTHSVASTEDLSSSAPIFSADDQNIELVDPDFTPVSPSNQLGSLPYSDSEPSTYLHGGQLLEAGPVLPGSRSHPVSLDFLNSSPSLLYSFTDPSSTSGGRAGSGITDSFSVSPNLYQSRPANPRQLRSATTNSKGRSNNAVEDTKGRAAAASPLKNHAVKNTVTAVTNHSAPPMYVPELRRPLPKDEGGSRDVTPTPDVHSAEGHDGMPAVGVECSQAHTTLTLPPQELLQAAMPLPGEPALTNSDSELPVMKSLDSDIETASVVSVQQLTETYLNEPPDFLPDIATPLSEGGKIPFMFPTASSPSLSRTLSSEPPILSPDPQVGAKEPSRAHSMLSQHDGLPIPSQSSESSRLAPGPQDPFGTHSMLSELPSPGRIPGHINQSASRKPVRSPNSGSEVPKYLGPTASYEESHMSSTSDAEGELERKLEEEQRSRIYLEGQLEAVKEECEDALKERPKLVSSLSRAEAELAEMTAALEKERMKHRLAPKTPLEDVSAAEKAAEKLRDTEQALTREKRALADLKSRLGEEEHKSRRLEKNLEDAKKSLEDHESDTSKLRDKLQQSHAEVSQKADKFEEMVCRLSSLGASYDALEQNKSWLHDQLQEAQKAKLKLQEELRESKTSGIAHDIKCDQLEKESMAHQEQIANLLQGVLQDKAKMVSQLETIKEDVMSHEDLYAMLIAEKTQLEDTVRRKDEALAQLGSDVARARVEREELEKKLHDAHSANEQLASRNDEMGRDNKRLSHKLGASLRDLEERDSDLKEVGKIKSSLQDKFRNTDADLAGKDGTIHSLQEANDLLQQELALVNDAKGNLERESAESKRELAVLEADLKSALERCREGGSRLRGVLESQHSMDDQKQALRTLLEGRDRELEQKEQEIKSMEAQMDELLKDFGSLQDNFKSIASESGLVTNSIAEKDRVISHLSSEKDVRDEELHSLGRESEDLRDKLAQLQHEKAHLLGQVEGSVDQGNYKRALQEKAQLQEELNSFKVDQKRDEIKANSKVNRLETDLKAAQKAASEAQKELDSFRERINEELGQSNETKHRMEADFRVANERLQAAVADKEKAENILGSLKPSEHKVQGVLKAKCERLEEQNADLAEQLQHMAQQKADVERASGLVAAKLKQNAEKEKRKLVEKNREVSLELERLRGRLAGMHTTQVTVRDHATSLEAALAKKESLIVKLSAEAQKVLEDKSQDGEVFKTQIGALDKQLKDLNADVTFQCEKAEGEKRRAEKLESEIRKHESSYSKQADQSTTDSEVEFSHLNHRLAALSSEKESLQSDVSYLKSQLLIAKTSAESAKRQIADKASQVEILERELRILESRSEQAEEEVRQLQEHLRTGRVRHEAKGGEFLKEAAGTGAEGGLSRAAVQEEETDQPGSQPGSQSGLGSDIMEARADNDIEKMAKLNDTLRDLGSRVVQARLQGQEAAELKKSGEISVLQKELGSKSKTLSTLQSYLHGLKDDMNKLHSQMDHHSAAMKESYKSSRLIEGQIEDLRRNSSLPSPFMLHTPTEQSQ